MVISSLNTKMLEDRLGFINESLARLRRLSAMSEAEFLADDRPAAAESYIRRTLEAMFDMGRHIVAKRAGKGLVEYREIADALADMKVISRAYAERLRLMAGYRNRLVHFYRDVTEKELHAILKHHLEDIGAFVKEIKSFLAAYHCERPS